MDEIKKECESIIDDICDKFGYDSEDKDGNKSLKTILKEIVPCMLIDSDKEERDLFYQMLEHTPIEVVEKINQEKYDELIKKYIGDVNPHIVDEKKELGEYGNGVAPGAYVSELIISEDLKIEGKKSFIYIDKLINDKAVELLQTDINVPHLIHELGHAWAAEKEQYEMLEDGTLKERVGTAQFMYSFKQIEDGKFMRTNSQVTGLYLEEALNTVQEENTMARYLNINKEQIHEAYKVLVPSNYQGLMAEMTRALLDRTDGEDIKKWRITGVESYIKNQENMMSQTKYWKERENIFLQDKEGEISYNNKKQIFSQIDKQKVSDFFRKYENVYFPDIVNMTPMQKTDNVLEQLFNFKAIKYSFNIFKEDEKQMYNDIMIAILKEGYGLINQTRDIKQQMQEKNEIKEMIKDVNLTQLNDATKETNNLGREKTEEKIVGENNER